MNAEKGVFPSGGAAMRRPEFFAPVDIAFGPALALAARSDIFSMIVSVLIIPIRL